MDKSRRKQLKAEAKRILEQESATLEEALRDAIPVDIHHPDWGAYFTENTLRERQLKWNTRWVIRAARIRSDILYIPERPPVDGTEMAIEGSYLRCFICSDLLPVVTSTRVHCSCGSLSFGPIPEGVYVEIPQSSGMVKVLAKAQPFRWWQPWRRWSWWPRLRP